MASRVKQFKTVAVVEAEERRVGTVSESRRWSFDCFGLGRVAVDVNGTVFAQFKRRGDDGRNADVVSG